MPNGLPNPDPTHCPGSADARSAAPGYLCLYDVVEDNVQLVADEYLVVNQLATPFGVGMDIQAQHPGQVNFQGSWAVTAP